MFLALALALNDVWTQPSFGPSASGWLTCVVIVTFNIPVLYLVVVLDSWSWFWSWTTGISLDLGLILLALALTLWLWPWPCPERWVSVSFNNRYVKLAILRSQSSTFR